MSQLSGNEYIIVLDDDPMVARIIQKSLGLKTLQYSTVESLTAEAGKFHPVAAFVDIHLETETGLSAVPVLKAKWPFCPIIVITGDSTDDAITEALACGADDFVRKPIRPKELAARLQTRLIDQAQKEAKNVLRVGDLSATEINLFLSLLQARGTIVPRSTLKLRCWGQIAVSDNALDRKVYEVRRALREIGSQLNVGTAYGVGFSVEHVDGALAWKLGLTL
jgi:DNA-binding response OmpR family regulator